MRRKYLKSLFWIIKLQWQTSRFAMIWGVFFSIESGLKPIASTYALAKLLSSVSSAVFQHTPSSQVYFWLAALFFIEVIHQGISTLDRIKRNRFQQKMDLVTNEFFFNKMYELSQEQFQDEGFNTRLDRARDSLSQLWRVSDELSSAASSIITFIISILAILVIAPGVGILMILTIIPLAYVQVKENKSREATYKKMEPFDRVAYRSRWMLVEPSFMPEVRLMNAFKKLIATWRTNLKKSNDMGYENDKRMVKYDVVTSTTQPLISFGASIYFFHLLLAGTIGFDRFIFLRGMLEQAGSGAAMMTSSIQRLHELSINLVNFSEIYDMEPAFYNGTTKVKRPLTIEFKNVGFSYPGVDEKVLENVSFLIVPGTQLAIVGENGAGKSTLIKLLLRQYLPTEGTITVNGTDIKDIEQESYYDSISNLSQQFLTVSHLSIKDNLLMGLNRDVPEKEITHATDMVDATNFLKELPHKLDTRLDTSFDDGTNLSGGQTQRLGVARALLRNGDLMILDEPTSAIDAKGEYLIFNNIYKAQAKRSILIVSHRFSTVRKAEKIMVMEHGQITEYGSHEELLKNGKLYKEMFEAQAEGYK